MATTFVYDVFYSGFPLLGNTLIGQLTFEPTLTDFLLVQASFSGPLIESFFKTNLGLTTSPRNFKIFAGTAVFIVSLDNDFEFLNGNTYNLLSPQSYGAPVNLDTFDLGTTTVAITDMSNAPPSPGAITSRVRLVAPITQGYTAGSIVVLVVLGLVALLFVTYKFLKG